MFHHGAIFMTQVGKLCSGIQVAEEDGVSLEEWGPRQPGKEGQRAQGCEPHGAGHGSQGVQLLEVQRPDLHCREVSVSHLACSLGHIAHLSLFAARVRCSLLYATADTGLGFQDQGEGCMVPCVPKAPH